MTLRYISRLSFALLFVVGCIASLLQPVYAADAQTQCDYNYYEEQGIYLYDPCATDPNCPTTTSSTTQLTGSDNEQKVYNFWVGQGLSPAQAAGITGSLQGESSGFNPFQQQIDPNSKTGQPYPWPTQGYGIAQFSLGQRTAVTMSGDPNLASLGDTYTTYYSADYDGGPGTSAPPLAVNDAFLLVELNYLSNWVSTYIPKPPRTSQLQTDYGLIIPANTKLLTYLKTLSSQDDVAEAWTYLYEDPGGNIKSTAATRAGYADSIVNQPVDSSSQAATTDCSSSSIGTGGMTFDQANSLMKDYENNGTAWFSAHGFTAHMYMVGPTTGGWCTILVAYFQDRFSKTLSPVNDGNETADDIVSGSGGTYTSGTSSSIKPYSVISFVTPEGGPHTAIILGINTDGSVIVDEMYRGTPSGTPQKMLPDDKGTAIGRVEQWSSINAYIKSKNGDGYTVTGIAVPTASQTTSINSKLDPYIAGLKS